AVIVPLCRNGVRVGDNVLEPEIGSPRFRKNSVEGLQSEPLRVIQAKNGRCFQVCRNAQSVPTHVNSLVDVRRGALQTGSVPLQQIGIVIRHLLEMRDDPTLVNRITMEASGKLVVNTAARHLLESGGEDVLQMFSNVHVGTGALTRPAERSFAN